MKIHAAAKTDVGRVRRNNEDNYYADVSIGLFVVADGMGGHAAGEVASRMAVDVIRDCFQSAGAAIPAMIGPYQNDFSERTNRLAFAVRLANRTIHESSARRSDWRGMGTTVVAAQIDGSRLGMAHVGDSRLYLIRAGNIGQLTEDHSLAHEQVKRNLITKDEAARSGMRNILTRSLGIDPAVEVDLAEMILAPDDILLLCSDGLNGMVDDETILSVLAANRDPAPACEKLIALANEHGGIDNITVVIARFERGG